MVTVIYYDMLFYQLGSENEKKNHLRLSILFQTRSRQSAISFLK